MREALRLCPLFTSRKREKIQVILVVVLNWKISSEHTGRPRTTRVKQLCHRDKEDKVKGAKFLTGTNIFISEDFSESKERIYWNVTGCLCVHDQSVGLKQQQECLDAAVNVLSSRRRWEKRLREPSSSLDQGYKNVFTLYPTDQENIIV